MRMCSLSTGSDNVVPFRRPEATRDAAIARALGRGFGEEGVREGQIRRRGEQRSLMDAVYASGSLAVAACDRETKLTASRLQVYGFLTVEEMDEAGGYRRLRPSESVRARLDRPWRLSKPALGGIAFSIPAIDDFLFEPSCQRA